MKKQTLNKPLKDDFISKLTSMSNIEMNEFIKKYGKLHEKGSVFVYHDYKNKTN